MFEELKKALDEFYELETTIKNNQKVIDKLEGEKHSLEKKLEGINNEYNTIKSVTDDMEQKRKELECIINEMIKNINK